MGFISIFDGSNFCESSKNIGSSTKLIFFCFAEFNNLFNLASLLNTPSPENESLDKFTIPNIFELSKDISGDGKIDINDLEWRYLDGDGDFRSPEIEKLRDESDIIITNPPFSLFREFIPWIFKSKKKFIVITPPSGLLEL